MSATDVDTLQNINDLMGGSAGDLLVGDAFSNRLSGNGGKDTLTGGDGKDYFVFGSAITATSADLITDFVRGQDRIEISKAVMPGIAKLGTLASSAFYAAAGAKKAHDSSDRIIYDKSSGKLYYDSDGKGGAAAIHFATLTDKPLIGASDFLIV